MRILHVIPGLTAERGGPSTVLEALTRHQSAAGHSVSVLTTDQGLRNGETAVELIENVQFNQFKVIGSDRLAYVPHFDRLAVPLIAKAEVVHLHSIFTYPIHAALRIAARLNVPVVLRPCGLLHSYSLIRRKFLKYAYLRRWGSRIMAACSAWHFTSRNELTHSWPMRQEPKGGLRSFVLPNGIEPQRYVGDREQARRSVAIRWPELGDSPFVLFMSRIHEKKRLDVLIRAFLEGAPSQVKLVVAGPDEQRLWPELAKNLLASQRDRTRVVRLGMVSGTDKFDLLCAAELFGLPSEHENFGNAALEAIASGTRVLVSPFVDLCFDEQIAGFYRAPLDVHDWSVALNKILTESPTQRDRQELRHFAITHFNWQQIAARLVQCYRWAMDGCTGTAPTLGENSCDILDLERIN